MEQIDEELLALFCDEISETLNSWESHCLELERNPAEQKNCLNAIFRGAHNLKGSSRAIGILDLGEFVHKVEDGITLLRDEKVKLNAQRIGMLLKAQSMLKKWVEAISRKSEPPHEEARLFLDIYEKSLANEDASPQLAPTPVKEEELKASLILIQTAENQDRPLEESQPAKILQSAASSGQSSAGSSARRGVKDEMIRVSTFKLDQLIQTIGELSIYQNIIHHNIAKLTHDRKLQETLNVSLSLTKEIYEKSLSLRMQPVGQLFQRLERAARDLARDLGKTLQVNLMGTECELDKSVLEKILDPLTHIVRNSVDHGIEKGSVRTEKQKSEAGTLLIQAITENDGVSLVVEDDGAGLNRERILAKAIEKGLVNPDQKLSEQEVNQLIFLPGFSTAEAVTDVSGRGVGMDVVKRTLEELSGSLDVQTQAGKGTKITITLPTSLSLIEATIVQVGGQSYAIPSSDVYEVIALGEPKKDRILQLRGQVLPFFPLTDYLPDADRNHSSNKVVLITRARAGEFAVGVDRVHGQQQIVVRALEERLSRVFGFAGGTILGSGEPALIVDLEEIISHHMKKHLEPERRVA